MTQSLRLLDACVAISLVATDELAAIAGALDIQFALAQPAAVEVGHLRDEMDGEMIVTSIDITKYADQGLVEIWPLADAELARFVELATTIDDGAAATIAIAVTRSVQLASDDRQARRVCLERGVPEPTRTLGLIHGYADAIRLSRSRVATMLRRIRARASFVPSRADPDFTWWSEHVDDA